MSAREPAAPVWIGRSFNMSFGKPVVMGVLNCTPDSFSDGGRWTDPEAAVKHGLRMEADGAAIIDVGGESTRPGAASVDEPEEIRRTAPVIKALRAAGCRTPISIDTRKANVAAAALDVGADIVNDVSACTDDREMLELVSDRKAGLILMHMLGTPETMQQNPHYENTVEEVAIYLENRLQAAMADGVRAEQVVLDPGIGFGKTLKHNLALLRGLPRLARAGRPVLIGVSRKSMLGLITGCSAEERLAPSLAAAVWAVKHGAQIIRAHDVKETCDALAVLAILEQGEEK